MGTAQSTQDETPFVPLPHHHYSPVEVTPLQLQQHKEDEQDKADKLENCTISFWKMNLLVAWKDMVYVGEANQILVFKLNNLREPWKTLSLNGADINQIRGGMLNGKVPVLVTVDDAGDVKVLFLDNLEREPIQFSNEISTWGCAISNVGLKIAVSANSHKITVWDLQSRDKISCEGHGHNVPCVEWSPCGKFIASASIDTTVRIWHAETGRMVAKKKVCSEWGWSCRWVPSHTIKTIAVEPRVWENLQNRLRQYFAVAEDEDDEDSDEDDDEVDLFGEDEESAEDEEQLSHDEEMEPESSSEPHIPPTITMTEPTSPSPPELAELPNEEPQHEEEEQEDIIIEDEAEISKPEDEQLREVEADQAVLKRLLTLLRSRASKSKQKRQKQNPKEENLPPIEPPSDYLIFASQHHLYLLDNKLQTIAVLYNAIPRPLIPVPIWMHPMQRISLLEYVPELSLAVVGSQGCASVLLVRIVKNSQTGVFEMLPERALPHTPVPSPIAGMWITKHMPNYSGTFHNWNPTLRRTEAKPATANNENNNNNASSSSNAEEEWNEIEGETTEQFYGSGFCMWRLFILFQNNKIFCYELRRDDSVNTLVHLTEPLL